MTGTILLVEDEAAIRGMLRLALQQAGFALLEAGDVPEADAVLRQAPVDLILLDWMLPGISGIDYARRLRREGHTRAIPIIMLTAKGEEEDRVLGLETGADDYITKPFSPRELIARIKAVLRRTAPQKAGEAVRAGGLVLDPNAHAVTFEGRAVALGPTEFRLLHFLMAHPGRVHTRQQLLDAVWGFNAFVEERTVDVHILRLRKALPESCRAFIQTVRGVGYRFSPERHG